MNPGPFDIMPPGGGAPPSSRPPDGRSFDELEATELYCPRCRAAVPVRKYLLLALPEGDKYEYRCQYCGTPVGDKMDRSVDFYDVFRR